MQSIEGASLSHHCHPLESSLPHEPLLAFEHELASSLLHRARNVGNTRPLGELLELYRPMLEQICSRRINRQLVSKISHSEITQVTLVSAAMRFGDFRGETSGHFRAWLIAILENAITDQARKYLVSQSRQISRERPLPKNLETAGERPSQICSAKEQIARLLTAVESLPRELRTIVKMRYQEDMTFAEIGALLELSTATTRRRWLEAVERIEQFMV